MRELPCPCLHGERSADEARVVPEGCDSASGLVLEELEVEEGAAAGDEAA